MSVLTHRRIRIISSLLLAASLLSCSKPTFLTDRQNCAHQLRSIGAEIALYRYDHSNQFPMRIEQIETVRSIIACPGAKRGRKQPGLIPGQMDYVYLDWSRLPHQPDAATN